MTAVEAVRDSLHRAQQELDGKTPWSDSARAMWLGYVAGLVQRGALGAEEAFSIVRKDLKATESERAYLLRLLETDLT